MERESASMPQVYKKILAAFDGSPGSSKALRRALLMARESGSEVTSIFVDEHVARYAPAVGQVEEEPELRNALFADLREKTLAVAGEYGTEVTIENRVGHAAQSILQFAQEGAFDLIVIGHSGHSGVWGTLLGSTTDRVVDHATCDVLVVR